MIDVRNGMYICTDCMTKHKDLNSAHRCMKSHPIKVKIVKPVKLR